jgi:hypothetical protein
LVKRKFELPLFSLFLDFFLLGASGRHRQVLTEGELCPFFLFFLFFLLFIGVGGCHHQVLAQFESPFFWLLMGTIGHHHQVSTNEELQLPFLFCFVAFSVGGCHHKVLA